MASNQTTLPNVSENEETLLTGVNENVYEDQSIGAELTKKDINRVAWRSMLLQASFNYERMCGVVINSGLSPSSQYKPVGLDWCGMWEISPILDRFEENAQKCFFLRFFLGEFAQIMQQT